jgi:hypothetical protein
MLTTNRRLVPSLRISGALGLLLLYAFIAEKVSTMLYHLFYFPLMTLGVWQLID